MEKGFLDDAKEILEKARKQPNYNKNIDSNLTRMHEIIDGENASEKKILSSIKDEKAFLVNFAEAYSLPRKAKIDGKWKSKHGEMKIVVNGNEIEGNGEITVRGGVNYLAALSGLPGIGMGKTASEKPTFIKKVIKLTGDIQNLGIIYKLAIFDKDLSPKGVLGSHMAQTPSFQGLMIISENSKSIYVMEKEQEKELTFYTMEKADSSTTGHQK